MYIEKYNQWIKDNPNKVCNKIKKIYDRLSKETKAPKTVSFYNQITKEQENK